MSLAIIGDNLIAAATCGTLHLKALARTTSGSDVLLNSPARILMLYITGELGLMSDPSDYADWPLYVGFLPDAPDAKTNAGCVYNTVGTQDERLMSGPVPQHFGVQLRIRSTDHNTGWRKIEEVANALDAVINATLATAGEEYEIQNLSRMSPILDLGLEVGARERRFVFTVNYTMTVRELLNN